MTIVSTMATTKDDRIYVRINSDIKDDFERVAEFRGLKPSTLLHSLIVKTVYETRKENPELFLQTEKHKEGILTMTLDEAIADDARKKKK